MDHAVLMNLYNSADNKMAFKGIIDDGTAIGDGIMNSLLRLRESAAKSKVIILLTDGIGRNGMAPNPLPTGGTVMLPVEIDEETMTKISEETGGRYFRAQKNADLKAIYDEIDHMERTKFSVRQFSKRSELYKPFALAALISLLLEILLSVFVLRRLP